PRARTRGPAHPARPPETGGRSDRKGRRGGHGRERHRQGESGRLHPDRQGPPGRCRVLGRRPCPGGPGVLCAVPVGRHPPGPQRLPPARHPGGVAPHRGPDPARHRGVCGPRDTPGGWLGAAPGGGGGVGMGVLALRLPIFRSIYLDGVPATVLPHDAAAVLYDTIVRFLRLGLRTILVLALVVAAGAFLSGTSVTAVRTREGLNHAIGWLAGSAERAGLRTGPVGSWVGANKRALRIAAVAVAALVLVFWGRPTGKVVLGLTLALLITLAVIEFLARPARVQAAS